MRDSHSGDDEARLSPFLLGRILSQLTPKRSE